MPPSLRLETRITCPSCGQSFEETMPMDACQFFWECPSCGVVARPQEGDCCVYCSYADVPCPPVQQQDAGGNDAGACCG